MEQVILVNEHDEQTGVMEKMEAHEKAILHRAFSVFIFNKRGQMLLQQRAFSKYHSGGLWTNTCCSHPRPGEETLQAAERRLFEEMGFKTSLKKIFNFTYKASFENGLTENEFDYVYVGNYEGEVLPNKNEVNDYCYKNMDDLKSSLAASPTKYTPWLHIAFPKVFTWWRNNLYKQE